MGEENRNPAAVYLDGQPVERDMGKIPEIKMDPKTAAKLVCFLSAAWQSVVLSFEAIADNFSKWIQITAAEVEAAHELETALRWASIDNRRLYIRYHHTKKKRTRKKYAKWILTWYRTEVLENG